DPKVAMLLEVSEGFKQRYLNVAMKADAACLLSALNILNEAEINYRQARNKRLHVELTLIKLCYLQQAIELVNEGDHVNKKKQVERMKPVAFKTLTPVEFKDKSAKDSAINKNNNPLSQGNTVRFVIEEEKTKPVIVKDSADHTLVTNGNLQTKLKRLSSLEKIQ